jgi:D-alanine-D-alanine ligase
VEVAMRVAVTYNQKRHAGEAHAEFDTREAIATVVGELARLGHRAVAIDVTGSIPGLVARLRRVAPDVVLNLAEGERGAFREAFYPALLDQLGLRHTGSSASALAICLDKALAKRVVAAAGVAVPGGQLVRCLAELGELPPPPLIVKPNFEGSSKGLALVTRDVREAVVAALARYPDGVLVEDYVPGEDVAVGWVDGLGLLPAIHYRHARAIYDYALKHETPDGVSVELAPLSPALRDAAARAFAALGVTGYGRADFRVTPAGEPVFLELNPLPSLTMVTGHDELYAAAGGELLAAILK